jgi:hypothetical protein
MDAVEYIKTRCRLCKSKDRCSECPLRNKEDGRCVAYVSEYVEKAVQIVEQWAKDHPIKTRQSEFLKKFPNAKLDSNGVLAIRPCDIDSKCCTDDDYLSKCGTCAKDYWLTEVPDND